MTDISLPYDQVCETIRDTAVKYMTGDQHHAYVNMAGVFEQFGHTLWRALEEAHWEQFKDAPLVPEHMQLGVDNRK